MEKILKLFDEENFISLEGHLQKLSPAELCTCLKTCIRKQVEETPKLITAIFRGLACTTTENAKRREAIYVTAIRFLQKGDLSNFTASKLIGILLLETRFFSSGSLANLTELYIESFKSGEYGPGKWLEGFSQILSCLSTHEKVPYVDGHMTGEQYKSHAVNTICSSRWPRNMIISLVTVFKSLTLSSEELKHVFDKILRTLRDVEYDSIPPLVYQTLQLTLKGHKRFVLEGLVTFFNEEEIKCKQINTAPQDIDLNSVEETCKQEELHRCEGTVLLHTLFAIKFDKNLGEKLITILKVNRCLPERVISPFLLCLSLCIASELQFQQRVFDCLRNTVVHGNKEKTLRKCSSWARVVLTSEHDINEVMMQTISIRSKGWDHVTQGLVQFGFTLMDFYGSKTNAGNCNSPSIMASSFGSDIIFNVYKENRTVRDTIVKEILKRILPTNESLLRLYLALLMKTIKLSHHPYFECVDEIRHSLDYITYLPADSAFDLLKSIMPLLAANSSLRDAAIILLHKAMFSRKVESRKIAVSGFINCLKHFRVMTAFPNSQESQASRTSQYSADVHIPMQNRANEALCFEVLGMLHRAFSQQADVRVLLYHGFPSIIATSQHLIERVLEMLLIQANLVIEPGNVPPLQLGKCYKIQGNEVIYLEPLPHLLACICNCIDIAKTRSHDLESEDMFDAEVWNHPLLSLMDRLTNAMIDADLENFELDKAADYSLSSSVGAKNYLMATIVLGVYEALIEFLFLKSANYSTSMAEKVLQLFERHKKLSGMLKLKPGKGKGKKKNAPNDEKVSICGLISDTVQTSRFICKVMTALFFDNLPNNQEGLSELRQHAEFQNFLQIKAAQKISQIQDTGSLQNEELTPEEVFHFCCKIGKLFFYRFTSELISQVPSETAVTQKCLEGFAATVTVIDEKFREKMPLFLKCLLGDKSRVSASQATAVGDANLCNILKRIQRLIVKTLSTEEDATKYKEAAPLIKVFLVLIEHLPSTSEFFIELSEWIDQLCKEKSIDDLPTVKAMLALLLKINAQATGHFKHLKQLGEDSYNILGDLEDQETDSDAVVYKLVNVETASSVVVIILEYLDKFLNNIDWVIVGLKSKFIANDKNAIDPEIRLVKEKSICSALGEATVCLHQILLTSIPEGPIVESIMLRLAKLYVVLAEFTKYYLQITTTGQQMCTRFEKLVILVLDSMTRQVYSFMAFYQQPDIQEPGRTKKKKTGSQTSFKIMKESKVNAKAVFNIESFEGLIIKLAAKTKNKKLTAKIKPSTNRDFRLDCNAIKEALARQTPNADSDDEQSIATEVDETSFSVNEQQTSPNSTMPPPKRRKLGGVNRKAKKFLAPTTSCF